MSERIVNNCLTVIMGAMFAGKSRMLESIVEKQNAKLLTCTPNTTPDEVLKFLKNEGTLCIDEFQFIDISAEGFKNKFVDLVDAHTGDIYVACLFADYKGDRFHCNSWFELLKINHYTNRDRIYNFHMRIFRMPNTCSVCGAPGFFNARVNDDKTLFVTDKSLYVPRCEDHKG